MGSGGRRMKISKCPYCGSSIQRLIKTNSYMPYSIRCEVCGAESSGKYSEEDAIEAWNRVSKAVEFYEVIMDPRLDDKNFPDHPDYDKKE
jgi:Lar family restriction alleviation protein